jgi:hypothetical protein
MQGTSSAVSLVGARLLSSVAAQIPSPPATTEFFFSSLVGLPEAHLLLEVDGVEIDVEFTSSAVAHVLQQITAAGFTAEFSNRFITISADPSVSYVKVLPYPTPAQDASILLGFPHGETFSAYSRPNWDSPAPGKNKETFIQQYENNLSSAVNRALSALSSNLEEHNRFLSDELAVPRFVNTEENSDVLGFVLDEGNFTALILRDRAYVGEDVTQSLASLEKFFVLTDKFGACSITTSDRDEPIRICDVVSGPPPEVASPRTADYFDNLPGTSSFVSFGDGLSVVGVQEQNTEIGSYTATEVTEGNKIRFDSEIVDLYPGCRLVWPAGSKNSGEYIVTSLVTDFVVEVRPTATGTDTLENLPTAGIVVYHSNIIKADAPFLYLIFDRPVPQEQVLHGFGLLYGSRTSVKDFLTTTLMGNLKGQAVSDIVVRSLQAIRGPNSRNYRSTRVGDPDGYDGDIDTSADGGDLISLETLANRSLLGRDVFDLSGGITESDSPSHYTITDGSRANAFAGNPLTLYGDATPVANEFSLVASAVDVDSNKWTSRLGGSGPFNGKLNNGGVLQAGDKFLPTDVGLTVKISEADEIDADDDQKQLLRVWTISKYISPDRVLLTCPDLPSYLPYAVDDLFVQFKFGAREVRNLSAGALLRLDKTTSDDAQFDGAKVNALVLADTAGITGVVTITPIAHTASNFAEKLSFSTTSDNHLELDLSFTNNSNFIYQLHPQDKDQPLVPSLVNTADLAGLGAGSWTTQVIGANTLVTFKHTPVMGATVVEVVSVDGTFDGLLLVKKVQVSSTGNYFLHLCDFALNDVVVPTGTLGTCRLYNLNGAHALRSSDKKWAGPSADSLAFSSFFGTGRTFGGSFSEENGTVARFGGNGSLDSVVEIRASGDSPFLALGSGGGAKVYVPRTALNVWASSPSQGIEVNTATSDNPGIRDVFGGTGVRIISFTGFRAHREDLAAIVYPGSAALIATQLYDADHEVRNDPVKRDPVAIFATEVRPSSTLTSEPDFATRVVVPDTYDTNAQVISYVCDDVYQRSDDRARWSVFIYQDAADAENSEYVQIYTETPGYADYTVKLTVGAANSVILNEPSKQIQITIGAIPYTAAAVVVVLNSLAGFSATCSDTGAWQILLGNMPGNGALSALVAEFAPTSIIQHDINTAIEAIQGDIVVTDGIFAIAQQDRLTGVGSNLIPVNPEVPLQPATSDFGEATNPAVGYDLGEEEILFASDYDTISTGTSRFTLAPDFPIHQSHINRKVTFASGAPGGPQEVITRYITGIAGDLYTVDRPIVFSDWDGTDFSVSGVVTIYGRRWRNIYAQNIEATNVTTNELAADTITAVTEISTESINVENLRVSGVRRKFIPASQFSITNLDPVNVLGTPVIGLPGLRFVYTDTNVGWFLSLPEETEFEPLNTAKLFHAWSPEISDDEYSSTGHTPENPLQYEITNVVAHYRYLGTSELAEIAVSGDDRDYAMVSIRTHFYYRLVPSDETSLGDDNPTWFAGGYSTPIAPESEHNDYIFNDAFDGVPAFPIATLQNEQNGNFAGYFSFAVVLRPQIVFSGLTITYRKVAI